MHYLTILDRYLRDSRIWAFMSFVLLSIYLWPLFQSNFYVPVFDNLDSNVIWFKMLAESGKIFAPNSEIIPNMMSGLPRSSYGSEFNFILWLYYFFSPKTAFIINEVFIHLIAFFSMFIFLKTYVVKRNCYYKEVPIYAGALYFSLLPFWSGAGASIALLPLVTYALLEIKNGKNRFGNWLIIILLPLYTSFIFLYMFYIILAGLYLVYDTFKNGTVNYRFLLALTVLGSVFLLSEYRLVYAMFFDSGFISHRTEFNIFFQENLWETYRLTLVNFVDGHPPHAVSFQLEYIWPIVISALLLTFFNKMLTKKESLVIWGMIILSFISNIWDIVLIHRYTLPGIALVFIYIFAKNKRYRLIALLSLLILFLSFSAALFEFKGLSWLTTLFPLFKALNMKRFLFVEPFIFAIIFALAIVIFSRKIKFSLLFTLLFISYFFLHAYENSFYQLGAKKGYDSFENYYVSDLFSSLKQSINEPIERVKFISYGMEPAVSLYNGLYTVDGYSTNYPLEYKHHFRKLLEPYCNDSRCVLFDTWGSKNYLLTVASTKDMYMKGLVIKKFQANVEAMCNLKVDYLLSPYYFDADNSKVVLKNRFMSKNKSQWDIYLYKLQCNH